MVTLFIHLNFFKTQSEHTCMLDDSNERTCLILFVNHRNRINIELEDNFNNRCYVDMHAPLGTLICKA